MPTTSPDSFFYPDDSSTSDMQSHIETLANNVQAKFTAQETWNSWTPTFDQPTNGGFSSAGTGGHMSGHYRRTSSSAGAFLYAEFRILLGTGFGLASGTIVLNLPVAAYAWGGAAEACRNMTVGSWSLRDDSTSPILHYSGTLGYFNQSVGDKVHFNATESPGSGSSGIGRHRMDSNDPITWAAGDNLTGQLFYRVN